MGAVGFLLEESMNGARALVKTQQKARCLGHGPLEARYHTVYQSADQLPEGPIFPPFFLFRSRPILLFVASQRKTVRRCA